MKLKTETFYGCYPSNLLSSITINTNKKLPEVVTKDILSGITYALSTLEENEQQVLFLRYEEQLSPAEVSTRMGISEETTCALEREALRKLRLPGRWNYIRYGIAGYLRVRIREERKKAYRAGFSDGYHKGLDAESTAPDSIPDIPIEMLGLSPHARRCLIRKQITTLRTLAACSPDKIGYMRGVGPQTTAEIANALHCFGIVNTHRDAFLQKGE